MKVRFLGVREHISATGCSSCGAKRYASGLKTEKHFLTKWKRLDVEFNHEYETTDTDGMFLLESGHFEEVFKWH